MNLTGRDYQDFLMLTISREIVDRAHIFRVTREEAELNYGIRIHGDGGVCFPHFLPPLNGDDIHQPAAYSVRDDSPKCDANGKAERKYVNSTGRLYPFVPPADPHWFEDPSVPVVIVEAAKSALALLRWSEDNRRRLIPVGISGCYGWRGVTGIEPDENGVRTEVKGLNPALASICRGHRVYILLDANAATNPRVQHGREWLADTLLEDKVTDDVRILSLPVPNGMRRWNGPDDFLAVGGDECFHELLDTSRQHASTRGMFHMISELAAGEPEAIIDGYYEEGLSFLGAKAGVAKTWLGIAEGKALRTG